MQVKAGVMVHELLEEWCFNVGFDGLRICVTACICFFDRRDRHVPSQCVILDKVQSLSCRKALMARVVTWGARRNDRLPRLGAQERRPAGLATEAGRNV